MPEPGDRDRLEALGQRIAQAKADPERRSHQDNHFSQAHIAWRMVTELVAGLGIGFGIGYGLDHLFSTTPLMIVIFTLFGLAAGVKTMLGTAKEINTQEPRGRGSENDER